MSAPGEAPRSRVAAFLVITFALTWAAWATVLRSAPFGGHAPPTWLALGGPLFLVGVFAPGLVALLLSALDGGTRAVSTLLARIGRWRLPLRYYAVALLAMPAVKLAAAVALRAVTGRWPAFGETRPLLLLAATLLSTLGQAGEEVGWRGYLLPALAVRMGLAWASLVVGVTWAAWHLPLFFMPGADTQGQSFPLYAAQLVAYSVVLSWLYWRTGGSLLIVMLAHAAFNNFRDILPSGGAPSTNPFTLAATPAFYVSVALWWAVAAWFLVRMRGAGPTANGREEHAA